VLARSAPYVFHSTIAAFLGCARCSAGNGAAGCLLAGVDDLRHHHDRRHEHRQKQDGAVERARPTADLVQHQGDAERQHDGERHQADDVDEGVADCLAELR